MCISPSHESAAPLLEGLRRVQESEQYEFMARAMPEGSGITPEHIRDYVARFCRKEGMSGITANWDAGGAGRWRTAGKKPPRVLTCALRVALYVKSFRNSLIKMVFPKGKTRHVSAAQRDPCAEQSPTKLVRISDDIDANCGPQPAGAAAATISSSM